MHARRIESTKGFGEKEVVRLSDPPAQYLNGLGRMVKFRPHFGCAVMGAVHYGRIGASVEQQVQASHAVVLRCQVHGDGIDAVVFTAKIVPQIRDPRRGRATKPPLRLCRCSTPRGAACRGRDWR